MSLTWFEVPPPAELGGGWSLRFLTAAQMLECRGEGEAKAQEERDKALWAGAALLSRVLLKEGESAFPSGEAVLASLTVGQIDSLTRRWWAQDDFSGRAAQEEWPVPEGWSPREGWPVVQESRPTQEVLLAQRLPAVQAKGVAQERGIAQREWADREQGENERFDMARYLALGGEVGEAPQALMGESFPAAGTSGFSQMWPQVWPQVWSQSTPTRSAPEMVQRMYRQPYTDGGTVMPYGGGAVPAEVPVSLPGQPVQTVELPQTEHSVVQVLVPETVLAESGLTVEELDRAVERDARRYDGGSSLY